MAEEEAGIKGRAKALGRRTREGVTKGGRTVRVGVGKGISTLSGKSIEQQVEEYSELYTQVLLGLHDDVKALARRVEELTAEVEALKGRLDGQAGQG